MQGHLVVVCARREEVLILVTLTTSSKSVAKLCEENSFALLTSTDARCFAVLIATAVLSLSSVILCSTAASHGGPCD